MMEIFSALSFLGPRSGSSSPKDILQFFNLPCSEEALIAKARVNKTASRFSMIFPEKKKKNPKAMLSIDLSSQTLGSFKSIVSLFQKYKLSSFCSLQFQLFKVYYFGG